VTATQAARSPEGGASAAGRPHRRLGQWFKIGFLVIAAAAGVWYAVATWDETGPAVARIGWGAGIGSIALGAAGMVAGLFSWRRLLADLGHPLPVLPAGRIFFISQLGKYLPGKVWTFVVQAQLGRELKVPRATSFAAGILSLALSVALGLGMAAILLPFGASGAIRQFWWLWLAVPVLLAGLHPRVVAWGVDLALRILRRPPLASRPTGRGFLAAAGWQTLSWICMGLHCYLLVRASGGGWSVLPLAVGGFALAYCAGVLILVSPGGVGVRELALGAALATAISPQEALAVVLVSRLALTVVDLVLAFGWPGGRRALAAAGGHHPPGHHKRPEE